VCCSVLQCGAVWCSVLPCVKVCVVRCCVLLCVAVRYRVVPCIAVCCSVLQRFSLCWSVWSALPVCCCVVLCVTARCRVLQCVVVWCIDYIFWSSLLLLNIYQLYMRARTHYTHTHTLTHTRTHTRTHTLTHTQLHTHTRTYIGREGEKECFHYIIVQTYVVGLFSRRHSPPTHSLTEKYC